MSDPELYRDAAFYERQYRSYRDDVAFYRNLALDRPGEVLELGAGTGRITTELARLAEHVVALEPSSAMRLAASERLTEAGLADRVELRDQDARTLDDAARFALAVAPFHMLNELLTVQDQDAVLRAVRRALVPGGAFACDLFAPHFGPAGVPRLESTWNAGEDDGRDLWLVQRLRPADQIVENLYLLDTTDDEGRLIRTRRRLVQRWLHRFELQRALTQAGFANVRIFGDFGRGPVQEDSVRYVAIATVVSD